MFLTCVDIKNPRPHFLWWKPEHNELSWTTTPLNFTHLKGTIKAFSGMCVRLTSITFPVIWSSVLISVTWVALLWAGLYWFFRIMFVCPVPKISQVMMKWRRRASHIGRFTLHKGRRATQLNRFTLRHNRRRAAQPGLMHAPVVAHTFQRQRRTMLKNVEA